MTNSEALKPCKCGKMPKLKQTILPDGLPYFNAAHKCADRIVYDIQHCYFRSKEEVIAAWKKRITEDNND